MEDLKQQIKEQQQYNNRESELSISSVASDSLPNLDEDGLPRQSTSPQLEIHEQLLMLQKEIEDMNKKLSSNEHHLEQKREENQHLQELITTLQHKISMKRALKIETKTKSGCCNQTGCLLF